MDLLVGTWAVQCHCYGEQQCAPILVTGRKYFGQLIVWRRGVSTCLNKQTTTVWSLSRWDRCSLKACRLPPSLPCHRDTILDWAQRMNGHRSLCVVKPATVPVQTHYQSNLSHFQFPKQNQWSLWQPADLIYRKIDHLGKLMSTSGRHCIAFKFENYKTAFLKLEIVLKAWSLQIEIWGWRESVDNYGLSLWLSLSSLTPLWRQCACQLSPQLTFLHFSEYLVTSDTTHNANHSQN